MDRIVDGFDTNTGVVVLATTNHPDRLDPAIVDRPCRFDRKWYFDLRSEASALPMLLHGTLNSSRNCASQKQL